MNNWDSSDENSNAIALQGLGFAIGLSIATFILAVTGVYLYMRWTVNPTSVDDGPAGPNSVIVIIHQNNGSDGATTSSSISSYPQFAYSEIGAHKIISESHASSCSICLADYEAEDFVRLLPSCGHFFHVKCIDPWLILHPTCPVCRSSPLQISSSSTTTLAQAR
ncbi:hypothetical protein ABFS82_06G082100 [Erythranthe guttata]|uniref:RING-type domain-containing protein n=1 Tax=Erythranthe guttata TaxID=4155 RepID=A0A022Q027_ERYGU|nr:PREDICTED: RING-H2 finger protein ATL70-like [Erythranthe guttata]EYU19850.1 hypothetical protein MIMGU_mgv1a026696mg [Erythranthe guttata]|eukprot:XP_012858091.1 PREDICTED: RING-H2 finger protein ATL70-like [Erythranthe guttata]